ncbi:flagellar hook-length control protein FliK [Vreelandella stevensii]|uniref:flagellar hook-length control protein FliK n=1 Tax=Vreelandella stevensii TaxID=502821 RepID=UPI0037488DAF
MNIDMLLSVSQGHASTATSAAQPSGDSLSNDFFRQALHQASQGHRRSVSETPPSGQPAAPTDETPLHSFSSALEALGIRLEAETLDELISYLGSNHASNLLSEAALPSAELVVLDAPLPSQVELQEIAQRLALMTSYQTETTTTHAPTAVEAAIRSVAEQLSLEEHEVMPLLQSLSLMTSRSAETADKPILTINQPPTATAQLIAASTHLVAATTQPVMGNNTPIDIYPTPSVQDRQPLLPTGVYTNLTSDTAQSLARTSFDTATTNAIQSLAAAESAQRSGPSEPPLLAPNNSALPVSASSTAPTQATLSAPVSSPSWPSQLGQQLVHITQLGGEQQVKMNLHPAELGPLSISLKMTEHGAQAHFLTAHAQVRQVLEQAIPQLREILAEQGIALTDASVGEQNTNGQAFSQQNPETGTQRGTSTQDVAAEVETNGMVTTTLDGRVDLYA